MKLYERFSDGKVVAPFPRLTTDDTLRLFPRRKGLRILFVTATIREWSFPNISDLGKSYVAASAWMDGHDVRVLDLNAERGGPVIFDASFLGWVERRLEWALDFHSPSVVCLGGIISQYSMIRRLARLTRMLRPQATILLGGGIASCLPKFMAERLPVDVVVQEEGEVTISEVLERIEQGIGLAGFAGVKGTIYKRPDGQIVDNGLRPSVKAGAEGLDHLPWPLRALWAEDSVYRVNPVGWLNIVSKWTDGAPRPDTPFSASLIMSRGCPYAAKACDFCYAAYNGVQYRLRSPSEIVDEMQWLVDRYGVRYLHFLDDLALTDYRWVLRFADELIARKLDVLWGCTARTNIVADDIARAKREGRPNFLERCHEAGMRLAGYGIESGSPTILKAIDKSGQTVPKMEIAIAETKRVLGDEGVDTSWMIGAPGETEATVRESVEFCKRTGLKPTCWFYVTSYPGTTFWQLALDKGLIRKAVDGVRGPATDDIIEEYFLRLGEQGEAVRTNFSDLPDDEIESLARWAVAELNPAAGRFREPHSGDVIRGATKADV